MLFVLLILSNMTAAKGHQFKEHYDLSLHLYGSSYPTGFASTRHNCTNMQSIDFTASSFVVRIVREKTRQYFTQARGGTQRKADISEK